MNVGGQKISGGSGMIHIGTPYVETKDVNTHS